MKQSKLYHVINVCWATILLVLFIIRVWNPDISTIGIIITAIGWTLITIIRNGMISATQLFFDDK